VTLRITNLSEETRDSDLWDLCGRFGRVQRVFVAQDKATGLAKGFAFVSWYNRSDAASALEVLNGFGYDHLILRAEWAKPQGDRR
jgi:translation initiation factor 3 subunit G